MSIKKVTTMELIEIQNKIYEIRGVRVMLDYDLAQMYQVKTRILNQTVKRNSKRFPIDFMFRLTESEQQAMRSQIVITSTDPTASFSETEDFVEDMRSQIVIASDQRRRNDQYLPYAFTEGGVAMLSGLLNSDIAIMVNISIMRAFVSIREYLNGRTSASVEINELQHRVKHLEEWSSGTDHKLDDIYTVLTGLSTRPPEVIKPRRPVGYIQPVE
jgi:hypothetical protein